MSLSARMIVALVNLQRKKAGKDVDWINISDALALTELGLAERGREGWNITVAGSAALATHGPDGTVIPLPDPHR